MGGGGGLGQEVTFLYHHIGFMYCSPPFFQINRLTTAAYVSYGLTPLFVASDKGDLELVQELCDRGANVNDDINSSGDNALIVAAKKGHQEIVHLLLQRGANIFP